MKKSLMTSLGLIEYDCRQAKGKRLTVKVLKDGSVRVLKPSSVSVQFANDFIVNNAEWILKTSANYREKYISLQNSEFNEIYILGKCYKIEYLECEKVNVIFENERICLYGDKEKSLKRFRQLLLNFAKEYFSYRFENIHKEIGVNKDILLEVRNVKSWWGVYSRSRNDIRLSLRLISRTKESIDSVIYHEFAHIKVQNHQKEFYSLLLSYCPNYFVCKKALKDSIYDIGDKFILGK